MPSCRLTNKPSTHVHPVLPCYLPRRKVYVGPCPLIVIPSVLCTVCTRWPIWVPLRTLVRLSTCSGRLWPPKIHTHTQTERPNRNAEFKVLPRNEGLERIEHHRRIRAAPSLPGLSALEGVDDWGEQGLCSSATAANYCTVSRPARPGPVSRYSSKVDISEQTTIPPPDNSHAVAFSGPGKYFEVHPRFWYSPGPLGALLLTTGVVEVRTQMTWV